MQRPKRQAGLLAAARIATNAQGDGRQKRVQLEPPGEGGPPRQRTGTDAHGTGKAAPAPHTTQALLLTVLANDRQQPNRAVHLVRAPGRPARRDRISMHAQRIDKPCPGECSCRVMIGAESQPQGHQARTMRIPAA